MNPRHPNSRIIHRIGGGSVANLRLKPKERTLSLPGISVLEADNPGEVERQVRAAFPRAFDLHQSAKIVGSSSVPLIQEAGFDIIQVPTRMLPNHCRLVHPDGIAGFTDENLTRLAAAFRDTRLDQP